MEPDFGVAIAAIRNGCGSIYHDPFGILERIRYVGE